MSIRVSRVSLVPKRTLSAAAMAPYAPAAAIAARHMSSRVTAPGSTAPALKATTAATMAPTMNWPSPPMFQKRILKARDRPTAVRTSGTNTFK